ncbi:MAG: ATP-binding cassette domain-containing protein [Anaerolineae bacterium]|nr:ATP-binding cassette domain-containing protein [Anaerolineae bacterium]
MKPFIQAAKDKKKMPVFLAQKATDAKGRYLHWEDLRFKPAPEGLSVEEVWSATKLAREQQMRATPFSSKDDEPFRYMEPDEMRWLLHWVDGKATGNFVMPVALDNQSIGKSFHVSSLIEEAFSSSRLEGAATTRAVAKAMLREGRQPKDKSERMIWNNYQAMEFIGTHKDDPLTIKMILELHKIVTENTLDVPDMAGVLRGPNDKVFVEDSEGKVLHDPPPAKELPKRLQQLCDFANSPAFDPSGTSFIHPVIQAVIVHFMIGYDHPFVDGNGRTARALFYWHMIRKGYWLAQYISISRIMTKAPKQYGRAYLETETDGGDLTYFILYQLRVLKQSVEELITYLTAKAREILQELERDYALEVDLDARIENLPVGVQQRVEILKALFRGARILILDEPTGVLTPQEADHLFRILRNLKEQGRTVVLITHKLREMQEAPDSAEALAKMPTLTLADIDKQNRTIPIDVTRQGQTQIVYHDLFTNGIAYLDVGFNLRALPSVALPYLGLFRRLLLSMGTEAESYVKLSQRIGRKTGGLYASTLNSTTAGSVTNAAYMFLRGKGTMSQLDDLLDIMRDVLLTAKLDDKDRFKQIVLEEKARNEGGLIPSGHGVVNTRLKGRFTAADLPMSRWVA